MSAEDTRGRWLSWPALLVALMLGLGYVLHDEKLETLRPPWTPEKVESTGDPVAPAKSWQDPIAAVSDFLKDDRKIGTGIKQLGEEVQSKVQARMAEQETDNRKSQVPLVHLMLVMVRDDASAEAQETRIRTRHALHAALRATGMMPESTENISFIETRWPKPSALDKMVDQEEVQSLLLAENSAVGKSSNAPSTTPADSENSLTAIARASTDLPTGTETLGRDVPNAAPVAEETMWTSIPIPYEWFQEDPLFAGQQKLRRPSSVLAVWLPESHFSKHPMVCLALLCEAIRKSVAAEHLHLGSWRGKADKRLTIDVIGPATSSNLRTMLDEMARIDRIETVDRQLDVLRSILLKEYAKGDSQVLSSGPSILEIDRTIEELYKEPRSQHQRQRLVLYKDLHHRATGQDGRLYGPNVSPADERKKLLGKNRWTSADLNLVKSLVPSTDQKRSDMVPERGDDRKPRQIIEWLSGTRMISPWSTVTPRLLQQDLDNRSGSAGTEDLKSRFHGFKVNFIRTIGTDNLLAAAIISELERRQIDVLDEKDGAHVALIAESDTFYGRAFPLTFAAIMRSAGKNTQDEHLAANYNEVLYGQQIPKNLHTFGYTSVLDGRLRPKDKADGNEKRSNISVADVLNYVGIAPESSVGEGQLDYVRRLSNHLQELSGTLREQKLKAVIILSTDPYDKLLLLKALRPQFPNAVFVTTDLDARLMEQEHFSYTRNLIVASSYGLSLHKEIQFGPYFQGIARFRDTYQTASYFAFRFALGLAKPGHDPESKAPQGVFEETDVVKAIQYPRLFEIGRGREADITPDVEGAEKVSILHPPRPFEPVTTLFVTAVIGLALWYLIKFLLKLLWPKTILTKVIYRESNTTTRWLWWVSRMTAALAIGLFLVIWFQSQRSTEGEPFSLVSGTSVWPCEIFRFLAMAIAAYALVRGADTLRRTDDQLIDDFHLSRGDGIDWRTGMKNAWSALVLAVPRWRRLPRVKPLHDFFVMHDIWCWGPGRRAAQDPTTYVAETRRDHGRRPAVAHRDELWLQYRQRGTIFARSVRIVLASMLFVCVCVVLMLCLGFPFVPGRGSVSFLVDKLILVLTVTLAVLLLFFVLDATLLCRNFVKALAEIECANWSPPVVQAAKRVIGKHAGKLPEWVAIQIIARLTEAVNSLIIYPLIVVVLMGAARISYFDRFSWPIALIIIMLLCALFPIVCAALLRRAAEQTRGSLLVYLNRRQFRAEIDGDAAEAKALTGVIAELKDLRRGAFLPLRDNPLLAAILVPSGGAAILALIEILG